MKKILFLSLIGLISITSAYAACEGGTMVGDFCKSNKSMNWWSAYSWCKANGMHLATMYEMCPSWDGNTGSGKCPELNGKLSVSDYTNDVWSATVSGSEYAFAVNPSNGDVSRDGIRYYSRHMISYFAFC